MRNLYISQFLIELYVDSILHACKNEPTHTQRCISYALEQINATPTVNSAMLAVRRELSRPVLIRVFSLDNHEITRYQYAELLRAGTYWVDTTHGYDFWNHIHQMVISGSIEEHQVVRCFGEQDMLQFLLSS